MLVAAGRVAGLHELQPHPGQTRPPREDRLEAFGGQPRHAKAHLDPSEPEQPLTPFRPVGGPCL